MRKVISAPPLKEKATSFLICHIHTVGWELIFRALPFTAVANFLGVFLAGACAFKLKWGQTSPNSQRIFGTIMFPRAKLKPCSEHFQLCALSAI